MDVYPIIRIMLNLSFSCVGSNVCAYEKEMNTYPRDISYSVDGNLLFAVQPFPVLDGPALKQSNHEHTRRKRCSSTKLIKH